MTRTAFVLEHVPFEGPGVIERYLATRGHRCVRVPLYDAAPLPPVEAVDRLVVMGGPMGVHDEGTVPFLAEEKRFLSACIDAGVPVVGICLGAQLLALQLGAQVVRGPHREIGWFPVTRAPQVADTVLSGALPPAFVAFHWHADTFTLPSGATPIGSSAACPNQGFLFGDRVLALQFHLESTPDTIRGLVQHCADELDGSAFVQDTAAILRDDAPFSAMHRIAYDLLTALDF